MVFSLASLLRWSGYSRRRRDHPVCQPSVLPDTRSDFGTACGKEVSGLNTRTNKGAGRTERQVGGGWTDGELSPEEDLRLRDPQERRNAPREPGAQRYLSAVSILCVENNTNTRSAFRVRFPPPKRTSAFYDWLAEYFKPLGLVLGTIIGTVLIAIMEYLKRK